MGGGVEGWQVSQDRVGVQKLVAPREKPQVIRLVSTPVVCEHKPDAPVCGDEIVKPLGESLELTSVAPRLNQDRRLGVVPVELERIADGVIDELDDLNLHLTPVRKFGIR